MAKYKLTCDLGAAKEGDWFEPNALGCVIVPGADGVYQEFRPTRFPQLFKRVELLRVVKFKQVGFVRRGDTLPAGCWRIPLEPGAETAPYRINGAETIAISDGPIFERTEHTEEE